MPTYINTSKSSTIIDGVTVDPNKTYKTFKILEAPMSKTDALPIYTPTIMLQKISFTAAETKEITISDWKNAGDIIIWKVKSCNIAVKVNDATSGICMNMVAGMKANIACNQCINKLYLTSDITGECEIVVTRKKDSLFSKVVEFEKDPSVATTVSTPSTPSSTPVSYLDTQVTTLLYVDKGRTDTYVANGSITKPFKSISSACAESVSLTNGGVILINPGTYVENVTLSNKWSISGVGRYQCIISGNIATGTSPLSISNITHQNGVININGTTYIDSITSTGEIEVGSDLDITNSNISTTGSALTITSGDVTINNCKLTSSLDASTISQSDGKLTIQSSIVVGEPLTGEVITTSGGTIVITSSTINNLNHGICIEITNDGLLANPNHLSSSTFIGDVHCNSIHTIVGNITCSNITGTNIIEALNIYNPETASNWVAVPKNISDALEELASRIKALEP